MRIPFVLSLLARLSQAVDIVGSSTAQCCARLLKYWTKPILFLYRIPSPVCSGWAELIRPVPHLIWTAGKSNVPPRGCIGTSLSWGGLGSSITRAEWTEPNAAMRESLLAISHGYCIHQPCQWYRWRVDDYWGFQGAGIGTQLVQIPLLIWKQVGDENAVATGYSSTPHRTNVRVVDVSWRCLHHYVGQSELVKLQGVRVLNGFLGLSLNVDRASPRTLASRLLFIAANLFYCLAQFGKSQLNFIHMFFPPRRTIITSSGSLAPSWF